MKKEKRNFQKIILLPPYIQKKEKSFQKSRRHIQKNKKRLKARKRKKFLSVSLKEVQLIYIQKKESLSAGRSVSFSVGPSAKHEEASKPAGRGGSRSSARGGRMSVFQFAPSIYRKKRKKFLLTIYKEKEISRKSVCLYIEKKECDEKKYFCLSVGLGQRQKKKVLQV